MCRLETCRRKDIVYDIHNGNNLAISSISPRPTLRDGGGQGRRSRAFGLHIEHPHVKPVRPQLVRAGYLLQGRTLRRLPIVHGAAGRRGAGKKGWQERSQEGARKKRAGRRRKSHRATIPEESTFCRWENGGMTVSCGAYGGVRLLERDDRMSPWEGNAREGC